MISLNQTQLKLPQRIMAPPQLVRMLTAILGCGLLLAALIFPVKSHAMGAFLQDVLNSFADTDRVDVCGDCHADWTGTRSRGDFALAWKMWDFDAATNANKDGYGLSAAARKPDVFNVGYSNEWKIANELHDVPGTPYPFTGGADKDGDGYITLIINHDRPGTPLNPINIQSLPNAGNSSGGLRIPPIGWDLDDNDASINPVTGLPMGGVPWVWGPQGQTYNTPAGHVDNNNHTYPLGTHAYWTVDNNTAHVIQSQADLERYYSTDFTPPSKILDLRLDVAWINSAANPIPGQMPPHQIPLIWTAPSDDDPALPGATQTTTPVHHYDIRFTTQRVMDTYNARFAGSNPNRLCSDSRKLFEAGVGRACDIRNKFDWEMLFEIADCGIRTGSSQDHLIRDGGQVTSNSCLGGVNAWNRGDGTPLMRVLYEGGFEDYHGGHPTDGLFANFQLTPTAPYNDPDQKLQDPVSRAPICPPCGPALPGEPEKLVLQEVGARNVDQNGLPFWSGVNADFLYDDPHDGGVQTTPNYIAADTVYWILAASDDSTKLACVETPGAPASEKQTSVDAVLDWQEWFCLDANPGDGVVWDGPFGNGVTGAGVGFESYYDPGFQKFGNIIAIKTGGDPVLGGAAITAITPNIVDSDVSVPAGVPITLDGIGFTLIGDNATLGNATTVRITVGKAQGGAPSGASLEMTGSPGVPVNLPIQAGFTNEQLVFTLPDPTALIDPRTGLKPSGAYTVEIWDSNAQLAAAWVEGIRFSSTNPGVVEITQSNFSTPEQDNGSITLSRTGGNFGTISVTVTSANGAGPYPATAGVDYTTVNKVVTWIDQDDSDKAVAIPVLEDAIVEYDETIDITLSNPELNGVPDGSVLGARQTATLTVINNDREWGVWGLEGGVTIIEPDLGASTTFVIPVRRKCEFRADCANLGSSLVGTSTVEVYTDDSATTAIPGIDYNAILAANPVTLVSTDDTINPIQTLFNNPADVNNVVQITVIGDDLNEGDETFDLMFANVQPAGGPPSTAGPIIEAPGRFTLTIIDNDAPAILGFNAPPYTFNESDGSVTIPVSRTGNITNAVSVSYQITHGETTAADFTTSGTLSWAENITDDQFITVTITQDTLDEIDETFTVELINPVPVSGGAAQLANTPETALVTIIDDDTTLQFVQASYSELETAGPLVDIAVERVNLNGTGNSTADVTVDVATVAGGNATPGIPPAGDYVTNSSTLTWSAGALGVRNFQVQLTDDDLLEPDETINLALSLPTGQAELSAIQDTAVLTILDDELPGSVQFSVANISVVEDASGGATTIATIIATRSGGGAGEIVAEYYTTDGTARSTAADNTLGERDFEPIDVSTPGTLIWPDTVQGDQTFQITINNDSVDEQASPLDEQFTISLANTTLQGQPDASVLGTQSTMTVSIIDSYGYVEFSSPTYSAGEDQSLPAPTQALVSARRVGGNNGVITVDYATADGATNGALDVGVVPGDGDYDGATGQLIWNGYTDQGVEKTFTVTVNNDAIEESDETVDLALSNPFFDPDGAGAQANVSDPARLGTANQATLTITDSVGTIQFESLNYTTLEDGAGFIDITVTRIGGNNGPASADIAITGVTATQGSDFTAANATLTWADNNSDTKTFRIDIINDSDTAEPDETATLALSNFIGAKSGALIGNPVTATLTIIDSYGKVSFAAGTYTVSEDTGLATITVNRVGGNNGILEVNYSALDGSAILDEDYSAPNGTGLLSWPDGNSAPKTITVPIINDGILSEPTQDFTVSLSNPTIDDGGGGGPIADNTRLGTIPTTTINITDSKGVIQFVNATPTFNEVDGTVTIEVTRTGGNYLGASVDYAITDGTAALGSDYTAAATTGTLNWGPGESGIRTFTITLTDDGVPEADETLNLDLGVPTGALAGDPTSTTFTIVDSFGTVAFTGATFSVNEDGGVAATIEVQRVGGNNGELRIYYETVDGDPLTTATAGTDYTAIASTNSLTWANEEDGIKTFSVTISNDTDITETDENILLRLSNPEHNLDLAGFVANASLLGAQFETLLTIIESAGTIEFESATYEVNEAGLEVTINVVRSNGLNGILQASFASDDANVSGQTPAATVGDDYVAAAGTLTWGDGIGGVQSFTVFVSDDGALSEADEKLQLGLSNPTINYGAGAGPVANANLLGAQKTTVLTIVDSFGQVEFTLGNLNVAEDGGLVTTTATLNVQRVGGNNGVLEVNYETVDGDLLTSAIAGTDYISVPATSLLSWGNLESGSKPITVTINNDADSEPDENILLRLSNAKYNLDAAGFVVDANLLGAQSTSLLTINDSLGDIQFSSATYFVNEDANLTTASTTAVTITVQRIGGSAGAASVNYSIPSGSAVIDVDYTAVTSGLLQWPAGDSTDRTITITVKDDITIEPSETIDLVLSGISGARARAGTPQAAVLTIIDSVGRVEFANAPYSVPEGTTLATVVKTITIRRVEGSGGAFDVSYATADGVVDGATAGSDYVAASGPRSWAGGESGNLSFDITVNGDRIIEPDETIDLTLSSSLQADVSTTLTITNDDFAGTVQFELASVSVNEIPGGSTATLNVTRVGGDVGAIDIDYYTADATAVSTEADNTNGFRDFEPVSNLSPLSLSWIDGETATKQIVITINNDNTAESGEYFNVILDNPRLDSSPATGVLGAQATSQVNIIDDDSNGTVQFSSPTYTVNEDGGVAAEITVTRVGGSQGDISVSYELVTPGSGSATIDQDYTFTAGTLTWLSGDSQPKIISIPVIFDTLDEAGDETVNLVLGDTTATLNGIADGTVVGAQNTTTLTILDSFGQVQFALAGYEVREDGGVDAVIDVTRSGGNNGFIRIDYATADGFNAQAGVDYTAATGTLEWSPYDIIANLTKTFSVPVINDALDESSPYETVTLALSNPRLNDGPGFQADSARLGLQSSATLTIIDSYGTVSFNNATYSVSEDGGAGVATLTVNRVGGSNGELRVDIATDDANVSSLTTATVVDDYGSSATTLVWPAGNKAPIDFLIPIVNEDVDEIAETVYVGLSNPTYNTGAGAVPDAALLGTPDSAVLTITDSVGTIQFDSATVNVVEDAVPSATIYVSRTGGSNGAASVAYATADGLGAVAGVDYSAVSGVLNWTNGEKGQKFFTVPLINDSLDEADETVLLSLTNFSGATDGGLSAATLVIRDSSGKLSFSSPTYTVNEDGADGFATITVNRLGGTHGQLTLDYATVDVHAQTTADFNTDYTPSSGTLTWPGGVKGAKSFTIPIANDVDDEPDETIFLSLSNPTHQDGAGPIEPDPGLLVTSNTAVLTIIDSVGTIEFDAPEYQINEDGGLDAVIYVSRTGGSNGIASIDYATANGAGAVAGVDYIATTGTLTWADNESGQKFFNITVINDSLVEDPDETVLLSLSNVAGANAGVRASATLTIIDSFGTLQFNSATGYTVAEDGASGEAVITVTRVGGSNGQVTVDYATADGLVPNDATAGLDYTATTGTLTWSHGDQASKSFVITIINDSLDEVDEFVDISLSNPTGGAALGAPITSTLKIIDSIGTIGFTSATYSVDEDLPSGVAVITVSRVGGSNGPASVEYVIADGALTPATFGVDYGSPSGVGVLNWADGESGDRTFTIPITPDSDDEANETIDLSLLNLSGGRAGITSSVLEIIDGHGFIQISNAIVEVDESGTGSAIFTLTRTGGSNGVATVDFSTSDGSAKTIEPDNTNGLRDYEPIISDSRSWAHRDRSPKDIAVTINRDEIHEDDETLSVTLSNFIGGHQGVQVTGSITIHDSKGLITFSAPTYTVSENGTSVSIIVSRVDGSHGPASVDYATSDGSASSLSDYVARSGTFTWVDTDASDKVINIPIISDSEIEGDQTVNLTLSNVINAKYGAYATAQLTITDSPGTLQFSSPTFSADENGGGLATITVTRTGGSGGVATVDYATTNNTATASIVAGDGDYESRSGTLTWANGDASSKSFTIPINSDLLSEGEETVDVTLSNATVATLGSTPAATLKIIDSPGRLQFSSANYTANENGSGTATITVTRLEGSGNAVSVNYRTSNGTATSGTDYTSASGTLNWANGDGASKTFDVLINNDQQIEQDETVNLILENVTGGAVLSAPSTALLTIIDNPGTLQFSNPTYSAIEDTGVTGTAAIITVTRLGGSNGPASVDYYTTDGTASSDLDEDYTAKSGTLIWADADNLAKTITIPITYDALVEGDEILTITLSNAVGATLGTTPIADLTIVDNDIAGNLEFTQAQYQVDEHGIDTVTMNVNVRRRLGSIGDVSVDYIIGDGTALAGSDYTATNGTLFWPDGDNLDKSILIDILPDSIIERGGETINLSLSNPTGGATLYNGSTPQAIAEVLIIDSPGTLQLTVADFPVNEAAGQVAVTVERVGGSGGSVSVDYATQNVTAVAGADYIATSGTLTWGADNTITKPITISIIDDAQIEGIEAETFNVNLSNPLGGAVLGGQNTATVSITNDDGNGTVQLSTSAYSQVENGGQITFTAKRVGGSIGSISVRYETYDDAGGSNPATAGVDYLAVAEGGPIAWGNGDTADKTFSITLLDDGNFEAGETFSVRLINPVNTLVSSPGAAIATITNDDSSLPTSLAIDPGWSMISVPTDLIVGDGPLDIFVDDLGNQKTYQWVVYDHVSSGLASSFQGAEIVVDGSSNILLPGRGYWVLNTHSFPVTLDDEVNSDQAADPFEMALQVGGGMFGNPYQTTIDLLVDVRLCNTVQSPGGCTLATDWVTWAQAAAMIPSPWITGTIYRYDTITGNYQTLNPSEGTMLMNPWEGYWYRTETNETMLIRFYNVAPIP